MCAPPGGIDLILDRIEVYLAELATSVLPKSNLAKAVTYARNQWEALRRYTQDGRLTMDNNVSERTLRHQAVGRKNWLSGQCKQPAPEPPCCTRSWPARSVIALSLGRTCARPFYSACMLMTHASKRCCRTAGLPPIPRRFLRIACKNHETEPTVLDGVEPSDVHAPLNVAEAAAGDHGPASPETPASRRKHQQHQRCWFGHAGLWRATLPPSRHRRPCPRRNSPANRCSPVNCRCRSCATRRSRRRRRCRRCCSRQGRTIVGGTSKVMPEIAPFPSLEALAKMAN